MTTPTEREIQLAAGKALARRKELSDNAHRLLDGLLVDATGSRSEFQTMLARLAANDGVWTTQDRDNTVAVLEAVRVKAQALSDHLQGTIDLAN